MKTIKYIASTALFMLFYMSLGTLNLIVETLVRIIWG